MKNLLIAGGSGLVGTRLKEIAQEEGYKVSILSRRISNEDGNIYWNPANSEIDEISLRSADYLVNLSGANIAEKAWTKKRKKELIDSRIKTTNFLVEKLATLNHKPKAIINASAIGFYESSLTRVMNEYEPHAKGFMGELCSNWELAAHQFEKQNIRTVILRIGLVLAQNGGAYAAMAKPAKLGIGSYIGSGKQKMPWVHIDDLCNLIIYALENEEMKGVYNTTVENAPSNKHFTNELVKSFNKFYLLLPTPSFLLKLLLGNRSQLLTLSFNPSAQKLLKSGFKFNYTSLALAFKSLK